ncbi:hypothetical protein [Allgaiera indica]|uniref:hypothetical protein n=1 Tax=Allgaiera indica TaxID=765699 RepID=UPI0013643642|nr:hypothetical protein [Allgaiera indica]
MAAAAGLAAALLPAAARAHASQQAVILLLDTTPAIVGAALAVAATVLLGVWAGWVPRFRAWRLGSWPGTGTGLSWLGFGLLVFLLAVGQFGPHDPLGNLLPLTIWTVIWVAMTAAVALLGDIWRPIAPWRGPVRLARRLLRRQGGVGLARLGHWPAVAGLFAIAWYELISPAPSDPAGLARVAAFYWTLVFALAVLEGEDWLDRGEALSLYFRLTAKIAPLWRRDEGKRRALWIGVPGAQIVAMAPLTAAEVAFVTLLLATVSFDGLSETFFWLGQVGVNPLNYPGRTALIGVNSAGLLAAWALTAALILGALAASRRGRDPNTGRSPLLLGFLPIATAYHVSHYLVTLLTRGQYVFTGLNDPFERGWSLLGINDDWASFGFLSDPHDVMLIWSAQVALIVVAHVLAVLLTLRLVPGGLRTHLPVGVLMVGYTIFGLWLLAAPSIG